jgi:hypothetical protein
MAGRAFDRVLRAEEDSKRLARYIRENPIRAALVSKVDEYPYSGSELWSIPEILVER